MKKALSQKLTLLIALCIATVALFSFVASQAYAFYHVHGKAISAPNQGIIEVTAIIDDSANNGAVKSELLIMPEGSTISDILDEFVYSAESKENSDAQRNYAYESIADHIKSGNYRCVVSTQADRKPGIEGNYGQGKEVSDYSSYTLTRYDNIAFIAQ